MKRGRVIGWWAAILVLVISGCENHPQPQPMAIELAPLEPAEPNLRRGDGPDASALIDAALEKARPEGRRVLVYLTADWCKWCHELGEFLDAEAELLTPDYEVLAIDVDHVSNSEALRSRLQFSGSGLPWTAILAADGELLVTSRSADSSNIGYPTAPDEIEHFIAMLRQTTQHLTEADLELLTAVLTARNPQRVSVVAVDEALDGEQVTEEMNGTPEAAEGDAPADEEAAPQDDAPSPTEEPLPQAG